MPGNCYVLIMAGGAGTRFWPLSVSQKPKQFLDVLNKGSTLLQDTYKRALLLCNKENIIVITNKDYEQLVKEQLPDLPPGNVWTEPYRKNTAPCVAYAAYKIRKKNPDAVMLVLSSDHIIQKEKTFVKVVKSCFEKASKEECLITIGIKPTAPNTGYGYIQYISTSADEKDKKIFKVKTFIEKPDLKMAKYFVKSGEFLWNTGMFVWSVKSIIRAFEKYDKELANIFEEGKNLYYTNKEPSFVEKAYSVSKNISIDYAILEKADNVYVRSSSLGWSDIGTWKSLYEHLKKDENKNAVAGKNVMLYDTSKCLINVPKDKLVVLVGLQDLVVVESNNMLLICKKDKEQEIKNIVNEIRVQKGDKYV
ncbi:MAG: mannose-1-phosphate guanylyltransferase [Bacteroidia bacterium]|nr:MAG: mannose-1-phosphate guanylyltransferase [Bacteroidia bacterium]